MEGASWEQEGERKQSASSFVICKQRRWPHPRSSCLGLPGPSPCLAKNNCHDVPFLKEGEGEEESENINQWNSGGIF